MNSLKSSVLASNVAKRTLAKHNGTMIAPICNESKHFYQTQLRSKPIAPSYDTPSIVTSLPGPKQKQLTSELNQYQKTLEIQSFVDLKQSSGPWLVDCDGNRFLDLFQSIASAPLGYNHPSFVEVFQDPNNIAWLANRTALGMFPPMDWSDQIYESLISVSPSKLSHSHHKDGELLNNQDLNDFEVQCMMCGSCANENAIKLAFMYHQYVKRGRLPPSEEDLLTCMNNEWPGTPTNLGVIAFENSFHGRLGFTLSLTQSKAIHKVDVPAFKDLTIRVPFPQLKYPLNDPINKEYNMKEEERCLNELKSIADKRRQQGTEIAALIVEPIQSEGGDRHASIDYFRQLRKYCKDENIIFICDEVQTGGCTTGPMWNHMKWELRDKHGGLPDIVVFAKKLQASGFYYQKYLKPTEGYRIFNTWCGDASKILLCNALINTINEHNLSQLVENTGQYLLDSIESIANDCSDGSKSGINISNVRGQGTLIAFDCLDSEGSNDSIESSKLRDDLISELKDEGIIVGSCGKSSVRLRPPLILEEKHCNVFLDSLRKVINRGEPLQCGHEPVNE